MPIHSESSEMNEDRPSEAETATQAAETRFRERLDRYEIRAAASEAGAINPAEIATILRRSEVPAQYDADGDLCNAAEMVAGLKARKGYLFASASPSTGVAPSGATPAPASIKPAMALSQADYDRAKRGLDLPASKKRAEAAIQKRYPGLRID